MWASQMVEEGTTWGLIWAKNGGLLVTAGMGFLWTEAQQLSFVHLIVGRKEQEP